MGEIDGNPPNRAVDGRWALIVAGAAGFAFLAYQPEIAPIARPDPGSFDKALVERGRVLANYGDCTACHTRPDGPPFAGNLPLKTPFGTIYTTNITPDAETGIGTWSKEAFRRSMKDGVDRKGNHLYPAFPYDHFTKVKDADIDAIYAYLMAAVEPVRETTRGNDFGFPFNIRATLAVWKALFLDKTPFKPDPSKDAEWNEGAYLVEGLGHCAACHSPRNIMGARTTPAYGGGSAEGWYAPAAQQGQSLAAAVDQDRTRRLPDGRLAPEARHGGRVDDAGRRCPAQAERDRRVRDRRLCRHAARRRETDRRRRRAGPRRSSSSGAIRTRRRCRRNSARAPRCSKRAARSAIAAMAPPCRWRCKPRFTRRCSDSVVQVIRDGIRPPTGALGRSMPAFGPQLSDAEINALVKFLRARFSTQPPWKT